MFETVRYVKVACSLFDIMVKPISNYNCEVTFMDTNISSYREAHR